jgi:hypothetical protein
MELTGVCYELVGYTQRDRWGRLRLRGRLTHCAHRHSTLEGALRCALRRQAWCTERGLPFDRKIKALDQGGMRSLDLIEAEALALLLQQISAPIEATGEPIA